jgi:signal transduction histidine kinase
MQQIEQSMGWADPDSKRVEAVVETLANLRSEGESLAQVAHDARNMVTALGLYCDLLEEPGVLAAPFRHYGNELRLVATASRRLVEKLVALDAHEGAGSGFAATAQGDLFPGLAAEAPRPREAQRHWDMQPAEPIADFATELAANCNLLSALAGASIPLTVDVEGGHLPVKLNGEDLTRLLVNLIKNAAEAMPGGGRIQIGLRQRMTLAGGSPWLALTIEDNGRGIPDSLLNRIFDSGFTTRAEAGREGEPWRPSHRGLGLSISRSIVEGAGGRMQAGRSAEGGARFEIELPVRSR